MNWLELAESEAETLLNEMKARVEYLFNAYGSNSHSHLDPLIDALQAHVDAKAPVQTTDPVEEAAPIAQDEPKPEAIGDGSSSEPASNASAEQTPVVTEEIK